MARSTHTQSRALMKHRDPDVIVLYHIIFESIIFQIMIYIFFLQCCFRSASSCYCYTVSRNRATLTFLRVVYATTRQMKVQYLLCPYLCTNFRERVKQIRKLLLMTMKWKKRKEKLWAKGDSKDAYPAEVSDNYLWICDEKHYNHNLGVLYLSIFF